jgi:hypothetical protein
MIVVCRRVLCGNILCAIETDGFSRSLAIVIDQHVVGDSINPTLQTIIVG